ncbi:hypothetical protein QJS04_geneDACA024267 [Acorus gramineus]|uniref:Uncharacterized protein n=1 Tax=Acorus gramineus TaxID=55184 RepID=A0AAV8ZWP4_ACOGR|nr:hypothetical protein QJS04_geneDACA024267 [Acorus gramineus]
MEETKKLLKNHFKNFFKGERLWLPSWKDECLPCILSSFGEDLEAPFSEREVREAIFRMDTNKPTSHRSRAQLAAASAAYHRIYGTELTKAVKKETSGDFEYALLTILRCAENPAKYFAKMGQVYEASAHPPGPFIMPRQVG